MVLKLPLEHNGKSQKCLGVLGHFLEENEWLKWFISYSDRCAARGRSPMWLSSMATFIYGYVRVRSLYVRLWNSWKPLKVNGSWFPLESLILAHGINLMKAIFLLSGFSILLWVCCITFNLYWNAIKDLKTDKFEKLVTPVFCKL